MLLKQRLLAELYPKYELLLFKSAHYYARHYRGIVSFEDLVGQAKIIFCSAVDSYDASQGALSTHLTSELRRLGDFCSTENRYKPRELDPETLISPPLDDGQGNLFEAVLSLQGDAKDLACSILHGELDPAPNAPRKRLPNCCKAEREMRESRGWSIHRTRKAWKGLEVWWRERQLN